MGASRLVVQSTGGENRVGPTSSGVRSSCWHPRGVSGPAGVSEVLARGRHPARLPTEWLSPSQTHPGLGVSKIRKWHDSGLSPLDVFSSPLIVLGRKLCFAKEFLLEDCSGQEGCGCAPRGGNRKLQGCAGLGDECLSWKGMPVCRESSCDIAGTQVDDEVVPAVLEGCPSRGDPERNPGQGHDRDRGSLGRSLSHPWENIGVQGSSPVGGQSCRQPDRAPQAASWEPPRPPCPRRPAPSPRSALRISDSDLPAQLPVSSISLPSSCLLTLQNETPSLEIRSGVGESRPQGRLAESAVWAEMERLRLEGQADH
ncbi:uncharacterized protein LOC131398105 [Diceros bicornis minor]|uniref:uncharacterized protein LOC131398105 n=1 Tax=Diceros bicornis minor TaxID=77932 RepID=UPI0026E9F497|nr:uncharacterized protein LOC131398105 [Diceros bicornis minor]